MCDFGIFVGAGTFLTVRCNFHVFLKHVSTIKMNQTLTTCKIRKTLKTTLSKEPAYVDDDIYIYSTKLMRSSLKIGCYKYILFEIALMRKQK